MEEADTNDGADIAVHVNSKIANHIDRLENVWFNVEIEIEIGDFLQIRPEPEPDQLGLCRFQLETSRIAAWL